jgi:hypothetical protein
MPTLLTALIALLIGILPSGAAGQATPEATPGSTPLPEMGPSFVLRPADDVDGAYITVEAEAGTTHTIGVVLGNADDEPLTLRTYDADAFTLVNGGFGAYDEDVPQSGTATWIDYAAETLTLESTQGVERELTVTIPADTPPGQYIAGIVLETAAPIAIEGSAMFDQIVRKSMAVFIIVPGETTPGFELGAPEIQTSVAGERLVVPVENTGNVLVKPAGELSLIDDSGAEVFTQQIAMGSVYAGMETTLELPLPRALPEGDYDVSLRLDDVETSAGASIESETVVLARGDENTAPLAISAASVTPMPSADDVQFAAISLTIENHDVPVEGVRVVLAVERDGEPVEEFPLASAVTLQQGETSMEQRYIPIEGWSPGEWTFAVTLHATDPRTGSESTLLTMEIDDTITVDGT